MFFRNNAGIAGNVRNDQSPLTGAPGQLQPGLIAVLLLTFHFSPSPARLLLRDQPQEKGLFLLVCRLLLLFGSAFSRDRGAFLGTQSGNPFSVSRFPALSLVRS